ncbi:MAG TPA: type II toxin-antitoxin system HicA family toxin [Alphaproteobacteria bacterium]|nr:type II toxin-antitoxin system HicA family toxin [Alphaproteobacteria bacterium]
MNVKYGSFVSLSLALLLLSTPTYSMQAEKKEEVISSGSSRQKLKKIVKEFIAFEKNNLENIKMLAQQSDKNEANYERMESCIKANISSTETFLKNAEEYKIGETSPEEIFHFLLETRMQYLLLRTNRIQAQASVFSSSKKADYTIIQTDPSHRIQYKDNPVDSFAARSAIDRYQFLNRSLLCVYPDIEVSKLSKAGNACLRASVTLHPLLRNETDDLGYPDMAGGYGTVSAEYTAKVAKFLKNNSQAFGIEEFASLAGHGQTEVDVNYYRNHFLTPSIRRQSPLHGSKYTEEVFLTPFDADKVSKILPLPKLYWLPQSDKKQDIQPSEDVAESFMPLMNQSKKKGSGNRGKKKQSRGNNQSKGISLKQLNSKIKKAGTTRGSKGTIAAEVENDIPIAEGEKEPVVTSVQTAPASQLKDIKKAAPVSNSKKPSAKPKPTKGTKQVAVQKDVAKGEKEPIAAPVQKISKLANQLKGDNYDIYESIFHSDSKVTFKDFKKLWQSLGGTLKSSGKGGSHRTLFYEGKKMGSTFRPHPVPTYGLKSRKFLRQALENMETAKFSGV